MKAIVCVGISASGKSTFAEEYCRNNTGWLEINRDNVRFTDIVENKGVKDWSKYKFTKANEKLVTEVCNRIIENCAFWGTNIVVSDTNLTAKYRNSLIDKLAKLGYEVEIKSFPIALEEAWKRDANRQGGVGHHIIYTQYKKWLEYVGRKTYSPDQSKPEAVIVDLDGTLADMSGIRRPYEWDKVGSDKPKEMIICIADAYCAEGHRLVFLSGRDGSCREETMAWLRVNVHLPEESDWDLYMRDAGSYEKDYVVKERLFWDHVAPYYNVKAVIDDRPTVVRLWHEIGIPNVICVGNPWIEF